VILQHAVALAGHFPDLGSAQPTPRPTPGYRPPKLVEDPQLGEWRDLRGECFGCLTVRALVPGTTGNRGRLWVCDCSCGGTRTASTHDLLRGAVKSCGHLRRRAMGAGP
jgi:hypothetical protein